MSQHENQNERFEEFITRGLKESENYECCMSLFVDEESGSVEFLLDSSLSTYGKWLPNAGGGDMGLILEQDTDRVVGIRLPLLNNKLGIDHKGPLRINEPFVKSESAEHLRAEIEPPRLNQKEVG